MVVDGWKLFRKLFKVGQFVVAITDEDKMIWGYLDWTDEHLVLSYPTRHTAQYDWDTIRFIGHDGFPIKKVWGSQGQDELNNVRSVIAESNAVVCEECGAVVGVRKRRVRVEPNDLFRTKMLLCLSCKRRLRYYYPKNHPQSGSAVVHSMSFGDPFEILDVFIAFCNSGNATEEFDGQFEEFAFCRAKSGAVGMLYDMTSIFDVHITPNNRGRS